MKTEYQKCMDGEFFTADEEMSQIVYRCKRLVRSLNATDMEDKNAEELWLNYWGL